MPLDERVLCIPTEHFHRFGLFQGFRATTADELTQLLAPEQLSYQPRATAETDPSFKQLIPYVILRHGESVFQYRRGGSGTETRLASLRSIGIGGHIADVDADGGDPYRTGMLRELHEEVTLAAILREQFLGLINDDRTLVGSVHLGLVHLFDLDAARVQPRESALVEAGFLPISRCLAEKDEFETWSQFALEQLQV